MNNSNKPSATTSATSGTAGRMAPASCSPPARERLPTAAPVRQQLPADAAPLADHLRHPRRARTTGPTHPPSMAAHLPLPTDQPRRPARSRLRPARPRVIPDDRALRADHRPDHAASLGSRDEGQRQGRTRHLTAHGPLGRAQWAKTRYGIATQTLPNGYCGLPVQKSCPHANACLTCPVFLTGPEFLPELHDQRRRTLALMTTPPAAATAGSPR